jgi:glycosyltransferase involved in cell wall biosynthesis
MGGLPYLVGDSGGWTVPPDASALAEILPRVVAEAPGLAAGARRRYEEMFSTTVTTAALIGVYQELIEARAGAKP